MVVALAGRRVDASHAAEHRFPTSNLDRVTDELRSFFMRRNVCALVCSAAAGVDLLALGIAGELGLRRRVVLPFAPNMFRRTSVVDRSGDWGDRFDRLLKESGSEIELTVLGLDKQAPDTYERTNCAILEDAKALGLTVKQPLLAVVVWDGKSRGPDDTTAAFKRAAELKGIAIFEIITI